MSWDCAMYIDTGGEHPAMVEDVRNVTYNNGKIFSALGVHPSTMVDKTGAVLEPIVRQALADSYTKEKALLKLEPENGWGGLDDSRDFLTKLLSACKAHPRAIVRF